MNLFCNVKKNIFPFVLIILSIFVYWRWVFSNGVFTYGDWGFFFDSSLYDFFNLPQTWFNQGFGSDNIGISFYLIYLLLGVLGKFFGFVFSIKLVYFVPIVFILPISSYTLSYKLIKKPLGSFVASLFFIFNTYFLIGVTGHLTLMSAFAFAPFLLKKYIDFSENPTYPGSVILALLSSIIIGYEARSAYIVLFTLFLYFLFTIFDSKTNNILKLRYFLLNCVFGILLVLLNLFWMLPLAFTGQISDYSLFSRGLFGDQFLNISNALTTYHPFWSHNSITIFEVQQIPLYYYFFPLLMFLGFYFNRQSKNVRFVFLIAIIGIFLTKQSADPFGFMYKFLYDNFPGFNAFREATKFFYLSTLAYGLLIGWFITYLDNKKQVFFKSCAVLITLFIIILTILNTRMFIDGSVGTLFVPRNLPIEYRNFASYIENDPNYYRTLWLPSHSRWSYHSYKNPLISGSQFANDFSYLNIDGSLYNIDMLNLLSQDFSQELLNQLNVRYIAVPLIDTANDDNFWIHYGITRNPNIRDYYNSELSKIDWLTPVKDFNELFVYENKSYHEVINISGNVDYTWKKVDNANYVVSINDYQAPDIEVSFSQSYHPDWQISLYDDSNIFTYNSSDYIASTKSKYNTNKFNLNINNLCGGECSDVVKLLIHFKPQYYLNIGLIISLSTLFLLIVSYPLVWFLSRNKK